MPELRYENLDEYYVQTLMLGEVVKRILERKAEIKLSDEVKYELKPISEFMKRMRVSSVEKFDTATYIATVNYYLSYEDFEQQKSIGVVVLYVEGEYIAELMKKLQYTLEDEDDPEELEAAGGTLCNLIAGNFKSGLTQIGYQELEMSHFSTYRNEIFEGVLYPNDKKQKYELAFEIKGKIRIYVDLVMGDIPKNV